MNDPQPMLSVSGLSKTYRSGERDLTVLHDVTFDIAEGSTAAIVGPSGSGKTTLLGLCAGLDLPSSGTVRLDGADLGRLSEDERALVRNRLVGFVFQSFQLIPTLTALENVMVPAELQGRSDVRNRARDLLETVGLGERMGHYPVQLSGGEQQRVALARAFINSPKILFADEPTGNLDADTGASISDLIFELNREAGTTLVLVTHDQVLAAQTQRILRMRGGQIVQDVYSESSLNR
ncbi:MAG TPA: ABC transporter ATP-binding protein [Calditrichia bacterium]|nr:ABC transporter ATP-binding protein [Calditrichia bacterium]